MQAAEPPHSALLEQLLGGGGAELPEEGLTSAALQEALSKVDVRREEVLLTLYAAVAERFAADDEEEAEEGSAARQAQPDAAAAESAAAFAASLAALQQQQGDDASIAQLAALAQQHAAVLAAIQETAAMAASVRVAAELQQRLADFDAALAAGTYSEAAWIAVELQKGVAAVPGSDDMAAAVAARVEPLQQQLLAGVYGCCRIDPASRLPALIPSPAGSGEGGEAARGGSTEASAAMLAEIWRALQVFGLLPQALQQLAAYFLEQSVAPLLTAEADPSAAADSPAGSVASSNLSRATTSGGGRGGASVERSLYKGLRALVEQVLCGEQELAEQLGALLWPPLAAAYIAAKLKPIAPQSDAEVQAYSRKSALGGKLEQKAVALHLLSGEREGPITRHIKHTLNRFLNARRNRFIAVARDLLLSSAAQEAVTVGVPRRAQPPDASRSLFAGGSRSSSRGGTPTGAAAAASSSSGGGLDDEDPLLACGVYAISKAAQGAVQLMREALNEAVRSGNPSLAQAMCGAVVDVAAMVVALPGQGAAAAAAAGAPPPHPAAAAAAAQQGQQEQQAQQQLLLPYPAALRHNDCHYVYQALCALPYQYAPRLQQLVHRSVNFVNPATRVRRAGQECLDAMVAHQEGELLVLVDELRQFSGLDADGHATIKCRRTVQQLLHAFRRLGSVLRGVLAPGVLVEVAARLIQTVCGRIMGDVMQLPDISVDESEQIPQILEPLTAGIHDAVLPAAPPPGGGAPPQLGGVGLDDLAAALSERTPAVMKLRELCELLDIRMVEIRQRWQEGRLQAIGFSAGEVAHLVLALFEDTDLRRDFLLVLEEGALL